MSLNPWLIFSSLPPLPTPQAVLDGLLTVPSVLRDKDVLASHVSYRLAQIVALAVKNTAFESDETGAAVNVWVQESCLPHSGKIIDVVVPIMGVNHTLRWQVDVQHILLAQRVEVEPDKNTLNASPAQVVLSVMPSVYDELLGLDFAALDVGVDVDAVMNHVHITGESGLAKWVSKLAEQLRPDVWRQLAQVVGATPASMAQQGFAVVKSTVSEKWAQCRTRVLDGDDSHPAWAIRHARLDELQGAVRSVSLRVDALAARVAALKATQASRPAGASDQV